MWIAGEIKAALAAEAILANGRETGGVLLGYWGCGAGDAVVTHSIGPGPGSFHGKRKFIPDWDYQFAEIARLYQESDRLLHYLGDWHSHPAGSGLLSAIDRKTLGTIARAKGARVAHPIMLVLAGGPEWHIHAWQLQRAAGWFRRRVSVRKLHIRIYDK